METLGGEARKSASDCAACTQLSASKQRFCHVRSAEAIKRAHSCGALTIKLQ